VRPVAIVSFAELPAVVRDTAREEVELVAPVVAEALARAGLDRHAVGFTCSGSCDYLLGRPFSFVAALDGIAPWPPIRESHVEMDGAWALYEAWVHLQAGDVDTALVYAYGKSSLGDLPRVLGQQLDPYYVAPLGIDAVALAGLQARALVDAGRAPAADLAAITALRRAGTDGAAAVVLAAGDAARRLAAHPAWIRGIDHRVEPHALGCRDLTRSVSTRRAAERAGHFVRTPDVAALHAAFPHEERIVRAALDLGAPTDVLPVTADPMIVAGLTRLGHAAARILDGRAGRAVAHATSGPCLQQNLVCVLDAAEAA
jgi:hypothetical protein